jgi:hypothetical protein
MRDKVLCRGRTSQSEICAEEVFSTGIVNLSVVLMSSFPFSSPESVPVSMREGEKMSIDEVLSIFDHSAAWIDQKAQREFLEQISKQGLDTIYATESLFKGTVVDFDRTGLSSGGGNYANCGFTVS